MKTCYMKEISFKEMKDLILFHRIVKWNENFIVLDNGLEIAIEETDQSCCAHAWGRFTDVVLDAAVTSISEPEYEEWNDEWTGGYSAVVKFMHNRNLVCTAEASANAGNGGYYYSIASFVLKWNGDKMYCKFVSS